MKPTRVMIVEDNTMVAEDCRDSLIRNGYDVVATVASGEDAIAQAQALQPDVVLMDIRLSGSIDGITAAETLFDRFEIPILFLSAYSDNGLLDRAKRAGSFGYLVKPYNENELRAMLETVVHKSQTEKKRRQTLTHIHQLEKTDSLGRMAGAVAHHYNNKLAIIIGSVEIAMQLLPPDSDAQDSLRSIGAAAQAAAQLGRQMMSCLGETFKPRTVLDLTQVCGHVLDAWEARLFQTNLTLTRQFPTSSTLTWANAEELRQIIVAVLDNACEAMGEKSGQIALTLDTHDPEVIPFRHRFPHDFQPQAKRFLCIEIRDEGPGIPDEDINRIVDPFFTTKFTGRGLGLAITLGLVRSHGGCISVVSSEDQGAAIQIWLPALSAEEAAAIA